MDECINKGIEFFLPKWVQFWTESNNKNKTLEKLEDISVSLQGSPMQQPINLTWDNEIKREFVSPADSVNNPEILSYKNKNLKVHFIGDAYGWIIVYY